MRTGFVVLVLAMVAPAVAFANGPANERESVGAVLDQMHEAAAAADADRYFDVFAKDAVYIGTDAGERWDMTAFRAYVAPYFDRGQGWTYRPSDRHVTIGGDGKTAWFDELLENDKYGTARSSGVLVRNDGGWRIEQYRLGFPIPNELAPEITERIRKWSSSRQPDS